MELRHLRYFLAVAEALNFTKAAAQLRVAQPALSRRVQDLEDEIGVDLLKRSPRGVTLTAEGKLPHVSWERIIDHIDHAVKLVGAEHVGLGSDFDGADMPDGMEDCSKLPKITEALLRKGYSESDIRKILGENTLRVMEQAEKVSSELQTQR